MKKNEIQITKALYDYVLSVSLREHQVLRELRKETAKDPNAIMQIPPEQGQFIAFLVKILGAKNILEIGTYTGYSTLCMALAMPEDGKVVACDINQEWTSIGKKFWAKAGVDNKIELHLAPALDTLDYLLKKGEQSYFDFIFIDADKCNYEAYYEKSLCLLRAGGIIAIDNVLLFGSVIDAEILDEKMQGRISKDDVESIKSVNIKIKNDERVDISMLTIADGLTLVRKI